MDETAFTESGSGFVELFLARQAILDKSQRTYGYELLFRSSRENRYSGQDPGESTKQVIQNTFFSIGAETVLGGKPAFINLPRSLILDGFWQVLPARCVVIEILEDVEPDAEVVNACRAMKRAGYRLALDDFTPNCPHERLLTLADFVKVEFPVWIATSDRLTDSMRRGGAQLLAEKVETREDFGQACSMGFHLFQGFFFTRPVMITARDIPGKKSTNLRIMQELQRPILRIEQLSEMIRTDLGLAHKLLRYANSAAFNFREPVTSVRQALVMLGETQVRRWMSIALVSGFVNGGITELAATSLVRARFLELASAQNAGGERQQEMFLTGLFSLLDTILTRPMPAILEELHLSPETSAALLRTSEDVFPARLLALARACESAEWEDIERSGRALGIPPEKVASLYAQALRWCDETMHQVSV